DPSRQFAAQLRCGAVMEPAWPVTHQFLWNGTVLLYGDNEYSRPGLWNEMGRVQQNSSAAIPSLHERHMKNSIIVAAVCRKQTRHVLQQENFGFIVHLIQHAQPFPHQTATGRMDSADRTSQR